MYNLFGSSNTEDYQIIQEIRESVKARRQAAL